MSYYARTSGAGSSALNRRPAAWCGFGRALTVALARRRGIDVAGLGELERALLVDGDAEGRRVAAERGAEALRLGLHDAGELRAARGRRRRHVAADVVQARVQADQRGRARPRLRRRRRGQQRRRHGGHEARHRQRSCSCRHHASLLGAGFANARAEETDASRARGFGGENC